MIEPADSSLGTTQPSSTEKHPRAADADAHYVALVRLTEADPSKESAWIGRAELARTLQEKITSLTRALELNPANGLARRSLHTCMQELLGRDASLTYLGETSTFYRVRTAAGFEFIQPKGRAPSEPEAPAKRSAVQGVYCWLNWSVLGLIPVGLGTLLFAPVTVYEAIAQLQRPLDPGDRRRMWVAILLSTLLWPVALALAAILAIHLT
jgi:hypothetical protein